MSLQSVVKGIQHRSMEGEQLLAALDWIVDDDCFVEFVDTSSFEEWKFTEGA